MKWSTKINKGCNEMIGHATAAPLHTATQLVTLHYSSDTQRQRKKFPCAVGAQTYPNVNNGELHNQTQEYLTLIMVLI